MIEVMRSFLYRLLCLALFGIFVLNAYSQTTVFDHFEYWIDGNIEQRHSFNLDNSNGELEINVSAYLQVYIQ